MDALIRAFWRILLLRAGPQSIPRSAALMWLVLLLHFVTSFWLLFKVYSTPPGFSVYSALVNTSVMMVVVYGLLLFYRQQARYPQTITALAGCEVLLGLAQLLIAVFFYLSGGGMAWYVPMGLFFWLQIAWNVAVASYIFRHSLAVSWGLGVLYGITYFIISIAVSNLVSTAGVTQ